MTTRTHLKDTLQSQLLTYRLFRLQPENMTLRPFVRDRRNQKRNQSTRVFRFQSRFFPSREKKSAKTKPLKNRAQVSIRVEWCGRDHSRPRVPPRWSDSADSPQAWAEPGASTGGQGSRARCGRRRRGLPRLSETQSSSRPARPSEVRSAAIRERECCGNRFAPASAPLPPRQDNR